MDRLLVGNRDGIFELALLWLLAYLIRLIVSGPIARAGEDVSQVLTAAGNAFRPDDTLLIDEEGKWCDKHLIPLGKAEFLLCEHGKSGLGFSRPRSRRFRLTVVDN